MTWLFRVASLPEAGGGHVRRCLVLAGAMKPQTSALFILDDGGEAWLPVIREAGHGALVGADWWSIASDGVVLDLGDPENMEAAKRRSSGRTFVAFRDGDKPVSGTDIVISQWQRASSAGPENALCGLEYAIVDRRYCDVPDTPIKALPGHVLVSFGYRDSPNATTSVLHALAGLEGCWKPNVTVVLGNNAPHLHSVGELCEKLGSNVRLAINPDGLTELLTGCDLAVGAGGISAVERAAAGRPSVTIALNAAQKHVGQALAQAGATRNLGDLSTLSQRRLEQELLSVAKDQQGRAQMATVARLMIDGNGAGRITRRLLESRKVPA